VGRKAASLLKAFGRNFLKNSDLKLSAAILKAEERFTKGFEKAEFKGGGACPTSGDAATIEAKVNALVADVVGDMAPPTTTTTTPSSSTTTTTTTTACDCCGFTQLSLETGIGSGTCGTTANFRCSGGHPNFQNHACDISLGNADCDLGPCLAGIVCQGGTDISCTVNADCQGICSQVSSGTLDCGGGYTGGGGNSMPLPLPVPDQGLSFTNITGCDSGTGAMTLGPTTPGEVGQRNCTQGRTCSGSGAPCVLDADCPATQTCLDNCLFGPPLPIPNSNVTPWSFCVIDVVAQDAGGTAQCTGGATNLSLPLRQVLHLTQDSLSSTQGPIDVPGIQPCPLCSRQCVGGVDNDQPCEDAGDCDSNTCDGTPNCIGGIDHGNICTPATSKLSDAFPTSHDCRVDPAARLSGGLLISLSLTTGSQTKQGIDQPAGPRNFCGYCRDVLVEGTGCFDGNPDPGQLKNCPDSLAQPTCLPASGSTSGCGNAIACTDDTDCTVPYESCVQRTPGAFSDALTVITVTGSPAGVCVDDGAEHSSTLVSAFCIPPTFDSTIDASWDLPGPGAEMRQGVVQLQ
jgi:hypothetical protein